MPLAIPLSRFSHRCSLYSLDSARNRLLKIDVIATAISMTMGIGAVVTGVFGMNLKFPQYIHREDDEHPGVAFNQARAPPPPAVATARRATQPGASPRTTTTTRPQAVAAIGGVLFLLVVIFSLLFFFPRRVWMAWARCGCCATCGRALCGGQEEASPRGRQGGGHGSSVKQRLGSWAAGELRAPLREAAARSSSP